MTRRCALCERVESKGKDGLHKFVNHHLLYEPEIIRVLCQGCHCRLHSTGKFGSRWWEKTYGVARGPLEFAKAVCKMYKGAI
jgi:uncharacterized protein YlaI